MDLICFAIVRVNNANTRVSEKPTCAVDKYFSIVSGTGLNNGRCMENIILCSSENPPDVARSSCVILPIQ